VQASITTFQNNVDDRSASAVRPTQAGAELPELCRLNADGEPIFRYYNVNKARIRGVETELKFPLAEDWKVTLNYTYNDGRDISNGGNKPLSELPFHTANGTVDWKARRTGRSMSGQLHR
jgi:outer membrane receptor for ferrienterochelin and colicins